MEWKQNKKAVSNIIGTMLLLGITITLFSVVCTIVLSYPSNPSLPAVNLVGTIEDEYLLIEHRGGESLDLKTKIVLTINQEISKTIVIGENNYLDAEAKNDNQWGIGEWLIYQDDEIKEKNVQISVVDVESNSIIMNGVLKGT